MLGDGSLIQDAVPEQFFLSAALVWMGPDTLIRTYIFKASWSVCHPEDTVHVPECPHRAGDWGLTLFTFQEPALLLLCMPRVAFHTHYSILSKVNPFFTV